MKSLVVLSLLSTALLTASCATEEGYTPINDKADQGGGAFTLNQDNQTGAIFFSCEEAEGCDFQLTTGILGDAIDLAGLDGGAAFELTLTKPDGFSRTDTLTFGGANQFLENGMPGWQTDFVEMDEGDYFVTIALGSAIEQASVYAKSQIEASLLPDWDVIGQDCTDDVETCSGNTVCGSFGDSSICTATCFMDAQCPSGSCDTVCQP